MTKTQIFRQLIDLSEATFDADNRLLRNVILIKEGESTNDRYYPENALSQSVPLFEGTKAYDSHRKGARSVSELTGWYSDVRYQEGKLVADRHFTSTTAGQNVMSVARDIVEGRAPATLAGLSINAVGTGKQSKLPSGKNGVMVESITGVTSVDDVDSPAAGGSYLFASEDADTLTTQVLNTLTFEEWGEARPDFVEKLKKQWQQVRLDETTKTALADADEKVQAAKTEAGHNLRTLKEAQNTIAALTTERDAALLESQQARRELQLEKAFRAAGLPASVEEELRESMLNTAPEHWRAILQKKRDTLKLLGLQSRPSVTGAAQQVNTAPPAPKADPVIALRQRLAEAQSPEELLRIQQNLSGGQS